MFLDLEHLGDELRHQREKSYSINRYLLDIEDQRLKCGEVEGYKNHGYIHAGEEHVLSIFSVYLYNISFENNTGGLHARSVMSANHGLNDLLACSVIGPGGKDPLLVSVFYFLLRDSFIEV